MNFNQSGESEVRTPLGRRARLSYLEVLCMCRPPVVPPPVPVPPLHPRWMVVSLYLEFEASRVQVPGFEIKALRGNLVARGLREK